MQPVSHPSPPTTSSPKPKGKSQLTSAFQRLMSVHWLMSWCYFILFSTGAVMSELSNEIPFRDFTYDFHKGMGALVIGLLGWRILVLLQVWWKKYTRRTPQYSSEWMKKVALHSLLYVFMLAVPISGFFFSNSYKSNNVHLLWITLPDLFPQNSNLVDLGRNLHFWISYTFLAFVLLHMLDQRKVVRAIWRRFTQAMQKRFSGV
ncbi:cytochrome b [bacterium]|nr:cytochrome b [bacterium]